MNYVIILMWQDHLFSTSSTRSTVHREALTCFSPLPVVLWAHFYVVIMSQQVSQQYACA
jgi:hypothetical protein